MASSDHMVEKLIPECNVCKSDFNPACKGIGSISCHFVSSCSLPHTSGVGQGIWAHKTSGEEDKQLDPQNSWKSSLAKAQVEKKFFAKSFPRFEICTPLLNYCNVTLTVFRPKKIQGVAIILKHFYQKYFLLRAFQVPLKSKIKFQYFSRTSRSSTNHV